MSLSTAPFNIDDSALFTLEPHAKARPTAIEDDRRMACRVPRSVSVRLVTTGHGDGPRCLLTDISEGGARVQLPSSAGLSVGQRLEVLLSSDTPAPDLADHLSGGCFATIVRTERCAGHPDHVEAGLRFDQPLML